MKYLENEEYIKKLNPKYIVRSITESGASIYLTDWVKLEDDDKLTFLDLIRDEFVSIDLDEIDHISIRKRRK